jgi:hypothetical protein
MNFITDNFNINFFSNSTKTDEDLDKFINKKFTYYLNNSNLLLNFVSDFEDYKTNGRNDNKSKCDECENLYILTSEIFETYINKVKIPFNISIYSEGKENSNINYKNKVLYFFDLKDLNKILQSKNLARSNEDTKILNKKRILCKIISLSFIKIYIIIKSIFQTFNNYDSLIKNKNTSSGTLFQQPINQITDTQDDTLANIQEVNTGTNIQEANTGTNIQEVNTGTNIQEANTGTNIQEANTGTNIQEANTGTNIQEANTGTNIQEANTGTNIQETNTGTNIQEDASEDTFANASQNLVANPQQNQFANQQQQQNNPLSGGGFFSFLNPFSKENESQQNELPPREEFQRVIKLQTSSNVFYSIFVILFENELTVKNFTATYLNDRVKAMKIETLFAKLPYILDYILSNNLDEPRSFLKNSLIFNNDNFKFLRLKTSDNLENDAMFYLKEIDEKYTLDSATKLKETKQYFSQKNIVFMKNYSNMQNLDLTNLSILSSVKGILQTMITNYFKTRNTLYDSIIKKLIKFNYMTNEIENINPNLTYENIIKLTNQTKTILLNLHSNVFESLNNIITKIREAILRKYGEHFNDNNKIEANLYKPQEPILQGGKTRKKYYKKYNRKHHKKTKKYN